jgi:hypothetical protein
MNRLLPLIILTACSTAAPAEYRQGAPMAPAFSPTLDAPITTGQPGYVGEPALAPRSPYTRVLPPTKEPGLWAAEAPQASSSVIPDARLLGVALPFIQDGERVETATTLICAEKWRRALAASDVAEKVSAMRERQRRCMVAMMFRWCWGQLDALADSQRRHGVVNLTERRIGQRFKQTAERFVAEDCTEAPLTDQQQRWWAILTHAYLVSGGAGQ